VPSSWKDEANRQRVSEQQRAQRAAADAASARKRNAEAEQTHKDGMNAINGIVRQFLKAMSRAGNPGRRSFMGLLAQDLKLRFYYNNSRGVGRHIGSYWHIHGRDNGSYAHIYVYSNGQWIYGSGTDGVQGAGPGGDIYGSSSQITSEDPPSRYLDAQYYQAITDSIRSLLVKALRENNVQLPRD